MTETEWLTDNNMVRMLQFAGNQSRHNSRLLRLFGCACCRRVWHLLQLNAAQRIVELAEAYADGEVDQEVLHAADSSADFVDFPIRVVRPTLAGPQLSLLTHNSIGAARSLASATFSPWDAYGIFVAVAGNSDKDFFFDPKQNKGGDDVVPDDREMDEQVKLLRDIFGNPFRPATFDPAWRTAQAIGIAARMYDERNFDAVPMLADALADAGCDDEEILRHCRERGVHVRGCWVVDLVLGRRQQWERRETGDPVTDESPGGIT